MSPFQHVVGSEAELRELVGTPASRSVLKERKELDHHDRAFIALSPFVLLATAGEGGRCDVSPKGDAPGFVKVLDSHRLVIPDRPGNKRLDGMLNLLANPHVGLIFLIPGRDETLRVNGRAWVTRDPALLEPCTVQGKTPLLAIGVEVEQCFVHCPEGVPPIRLLDAGGLARARCAAVDGLRAVRANQARGGHGRGVRARHRRGPEAALLGRSDAGFPGCVTSPTT